MLRNLNIFLKHSERILSEMNNRRRDIYSKGIIRNMKYSQIVSNSQKYGNYFLDASLQSHNLPTFEGHEGDLFLNAAYLAVYSLHERELRKILSESKAIYEELVDNTGYGPKMIRFDTVNYGENPLLIKSWKTKIYDLYDKRKKNNHNISTLESLFADMNDADLEDIAINLVEEFAKFVFKTNREDSQPLNYLVDVVETKISTENNIQGALNHDSFDRTLTPGSVLLSTFSDDIHKGKEGDGTHWLSANGKHYEIIEKFEKVLKDKYPNRREQMYSIFADYVDIVFSTVYIINYSTIFYEVYNKANKVVIFEGADNLGKSTLIDNIINFNENKFHFEVGYERQKGNVEWSTMNSERPIDIGSINKCTLKFHGYPVFKTIKTKQPKLSYIQYFSKYKNLPEGNVYARQFANLHNIITCTMRKMEEYFTSPIMEQKYEYENENGKVMEVIKRQENKERVLLQDRSVLSTLIYSLDKDREELTEEIQRYLNKEYCLGDDGLCATRTERPIGTEKPTKSEFELENGNYGPLDFLNVYESMINDDIFIKNSKLHPGCANFIKSSFVFLTSDKPFTSIEIEGNEHSEKLFGNRSKHYEFDEKTKKAINKTIPEALENVLQKLEKDGELGPKYSGRYKENPSLALAEDVWEASGIESWFYRNRNYKKVYQAYLKNRIYDARDESTGASVLYEDKWSNIISNPKNKESRLFKDDSEVSIPIYRPRNMFRFKKDDVSVYNPRDYTEIELAELVSSTIF